MRNRMSQQNSKTGSPTERKGQLLLKFEKLKRKRGIFQVKELGYKRCQQVEISG
jgi:hypothetical protein